MTDKIKELLAMLDLPEEEQAFLLAELGYSQPKYPCKTFADLAFRLRDEAQGLNEYMWACAKTYNLVHKYKPKSHEIDAPTMIVWIWLATQAKPIDWIIAALIAKELAKDGKEQENN